MSKKLNLLADTNLGTFDPVSDKRQPAGIENADFVNNLELWMSDIIGIITILATLFFIVYAFLAAFDWITAAGDKGKIEKSKDRLVWSTLGLILMIATYAIIGLIGSIVGLDILDLSGMLGKVVPGGI